MLDLYRYVRGLIGEEDAGGWVTTESGTHVFIENGRITKGPAALVNKTHEEASKHEKEHGSESANEIKLDDGTRIHRDKRGWHHTDKKGYSYGPFESSKAAIRNYEGKDEDDEDADSPITTVNADGDVITVPRTPAPTAAQSEARKKADEAYEKHHAGVERMMRE